MEWNYKSVTSESNGYEDVMDKLKSFSKELYMSKTDAEKDQIIQDVFNIYRGKNIFPITYYNEEGIHDEIRKCIDKDVAFDGEVLDLKFYQGQNLCRFLFPHMTRVESGGDKRTMYNKFNDDHMLKRAIKFCLDHKNVKSPVTPSAIKDGLEMLGGGVATNFKTMNAKALYEKYCPKDGIIYDFSCGFGGRMLGALTSKNNYKYFGVEPLTDSYNALNILGNHIENCTGRKGIFKIYKKGSEDFKVGRPNYVDFAFSSPPYFNLEMYSDDDTQCYNKFPTLEKWFDGYVKPTIENIHYMLKDNCYYAVNIADFKVGKEEVNFVDKWIALSEEIGFEYVECIHMSLQARRGVGHDVSNKRTKKEGIFVFRKKC